MRALLCFTILALLLFPLRVNAQENLALFQAKVFDMGNHPIPGAILELHCLGNKYYAVSNVDGFIKLYVKFNNINDSLKILISQFNYKQRVEILAIHQAIQQTLQFKLEKNFKTLSEVILEPDIFVKGDTTIFRADAFRANADNSLEDLLQRLPGMSVNQYGLISFNGKLISNILIEGEKLTNNYFDLSKNLSPDLVEEIQVWTNYNEIAVLKGRQDATKQVINLTLNKSARFNGAARIDFGLGIKKKYQSKNNIIALQNRIKSLLLSHFNNIGMDPYESNTMFSDYLQQNKYALDNVELRGIYQTPSTTYNKGFANNIVTFQNKAAYGLCNNIIPFKNKWSLFLHSSIYKDGQTKQNTKESISLTDTLLNSLEKENLQFQPQNFDAGAELALNDSSHYFKLAINYRRSAFSLLDQIQNKIYFDQTYKSRGEETKVGIFDIRRIHKNNHLEISYQYQKGWLSQQMMVLQNTPTFIFNYPSNKIAQNYKVERQIHIVKLGFHLNTKWISKLDFSFQSNKYQLSSNAALVLDNDIQLDTFQLNNIMKSRNGTFIINGSWKINRWLFDYGLGISYLFESIRGSTDFKNKTYPFLDLNLQVPINSYHKLNFTLKSNEPSFFQQIIVPQYYFQNYRVYRENRLNEMYRHSYNVGVLYNHFLARKNRNLLVYYQASISAPQIINSIQYDGAYNSKAVTSSMNEYGVRLQTLFGQYNSNLKFIDSKFKLSASASLLKQYTTSSTFNKQLSFTTQISLKREWFNDLSTEAGISLNFNNTLHSNYNYQSYNPFLEIQAKILRQVSGSFYFKSMNTKSNNQHSDFHLLNLNLFWKSDKSKWQFRFSANNILNNRFLLTNSFDPYFIIYYKESILQRYLMLQTSFTF